MDAFRYVGNAGQGRYFPSHGKANKYECTIDQKLEDAAAQAPGIRWVSTHQVAALFCVKWRDGCHCEIVTS